MSRLTALPNELLEDIIHRTHATSPESLAALSLTCKRLQVFVRSRQWQNLVVPWRLRKSSCLERFIDSHRGNEAIECVRLVPQISVLNAFRVNMSSAFHHLNGLCETFASLSELTTFSIFLDGQVDLRCRMPGPVLARIVRALPPSLTNLEVDTEGTDRIWDQKPSESPSDHLCVAISERMQQLETLWLRLSCLCTDLFGNLHDISTTQATSVLRRAFIRLDTSPGREIPIDITTRVGDCHLPTPSCKHTSAKGSHETLKVEKLFKILLGLQAAGVFPSLERFALYSWFEDGRKDKYIRVRDVATRTTTHYPIVTATFLNLMAFEDKDDSTMSVIRSHEGDDFYGDRKDHERAILFDTSWNETESGVRLPPSSPLAHNEPRLRTEELLSHPQIIQLQTKERKYRGGAFGADTLQYTQKLGNSIVVVERM